MNAVHPEVGRPLDLPKTALEPTASPPDVQNRDRDPDATGLAVSAATRLQLSVIVPTRDEAGNIDELLRRLDAALGDCEAEVIFVDDSNDDTPSTISRAADRSVRSVRLMHRPARERTGGLGGAVVAGLRASLAPWAVVMDGDLQHPPEVVTTLLQTGMHGDIDVVAGSRYTGQGEATGLDGPMRTSVSAMCTRLTKVAFPVRLRAVSDPMSGLFAVRLASLNLDDLKPPGFKVLLEILVRSRALRTSEVPYAFQDRFSGTSKTSAREGLRFLRQLLVLRLVSGPPRLHQLLKFLAVGGSGVAVNTLVLWLLSTAGMLPYLLGSAVATQIATLWNFVLLDRFVFRDEQARQVWARFGRFWLLNLALLPVQLALLALAVDGFQSDPVEANVAVLGVVFFLRYAASAGWVYRVDNHAQAPSVPSASPLESAGGARSVPQTSVRRPYPASRGRSRYVARAALPPFVTLVTFPGILPTLGAGSAAGLALALGVLAGWLMLWFLAGAPLPDEPEVHDRQLDVILASPLLVASGWLAFRVHGPLTQSLPSVGVVALTLFLAGTSQLLLGTRLSMRLYWVMSLCLLAMPVVTDDSVVLLVLALLGAGMLAGRFVAPRGRSGARSVRRQVRLARLQPLPKVKPGLALVGLAVALIWGNAALSTATSARQAGQGRLTSLAPSQARAAGATVAPPPRSTVPRQQPVLPQRFVPGQQGSPGDPARAGQLLQRFAYSTDVAERRRLLQQYAAIAGRSLTTSRR